ncbi:NADH pyrophosphatase [Xenophilus sp. AP218F]|nr:NADH pyrophosphatase [Xenophilus sp. AP218F]
MPFQLPACPDPALPERWCVFDQQSLLLLDGRLPGREAADWTLSQRRFLGIHDGHNLFMAELIGQPPPGGDWLPLRAALLSQPAELTQAIARAAQLRQFHLNHRYCGRCAAPLQTNADQVGKHCPSCGQLFYPRLSPAMMVLVYRGREVLLARSPHFSPGVYSALAGFVEPGETVEECVHRETLEEVGVRLKNLRYVCSQSWPFPHSLMLAFTAEYDGGDILPQEGEIEDARWFDIDSLPLTPPSISIASQLLRHGRAMLRGAD